MGESGQSKEANHTAYIAASYIKYIEAAGARAVPILWTMDDAEITRRFHAVNGLLFPGKSSRWVNAKSSRWVTLRALAG
jgi:hypothetical protein